MKNNTNESKLLLEKALQVLPPDYALSGVRYHLKVALNEIYKLESKRHKREIVRQTTEEKYREELAKFFVSSQQAPAVLDALDRMIKQEQQKLLKPVQTDEEQLLD